MTVLHICAGWEETNGAAVIARLLAGEQQAAGHDVRFARWASPSALRKADEVWTHCGWLPVLWWAGLWARKLVRVPEACYDPVRLAYHGWKKRLVRPIERFFVRKAARVIATCAAEADWIRAYEPKAKVEVTDVKRFFKGLGLEAARAPLPRPHGTLSLLYLGRRHPLKGVGNLERAVRELGAEGRRVELKVVSDAVGAEKEKSWAACDALVLPTLSDNFGLVVAEALERGKRVIVTDGAPAWAGDGRVVYLEGYRDGTDEERVALLKRAIGELAARG